VYSQPAYFFISNRVVRSVPVKTTEADQMTFHRTAGKGGTRNSARTKHIDEYAPDFNKSQGSGANPRGKKQNNPGKQSGRYDRMMAIARDPGATEAGRRPKRSKLEQMLAGKSGVTDF
jgi:hypothetical protein